MTLAPTLDARPVKKPEPAKATEPKRWVNRWRLSHSLRPLEYLGPIPEPAHDR